MTDGVGCGIGALGFGIDGRMDRVLMAGENVQYNAAMMAMSPKTMRRMAMVRFDIGLLWLSSF